MFDSAAFDQTSFAETSFDFGGGPPPDDTTPDQFYFPAHIGVALNDTITSDPAVISGINAPSPITVSGGEYSINGGAFTSSAGNVDVGDSILARHTSASAYLTSVTTTVTIGGVSGAFRSRTQGDPEQAAYIGRPFSFNWWRA